MKIETKYNVGDKVWIVYEASNQYGKTGEVSIYSATIEAIWVDNDGVYYSTEYNENKEDEIVLYTDHEGLVKAITNLMNKINEREEKEKNDRL